MYGYENIYRSTEKRRCCRCDEVTASHNIYEGLCMRCYWTLAANALKKE